MIDFGYSSYQISVANIYFGIGGFMNWSYGAAATPAGNVGGYRTLMGVGF